MGISISGSNSVVEFLPSKQAVAGSSTDDRSLRYTVSLQADFTPVGNNQAVKRQASGRCFVVQQCVQRHPASQNRIASRKSFFVPFKHLFSSNAVLVSPSGPLLRS